MNEVIVLPLLYALIATVWLLSEVENRLDGYHSYLREDGENGIVVQIEYLHH